MGQPTVEYAINADSNPAFLPKDAFEATKVERIGSDGKKYYETLGYHINPKSGYALLTDEVLTNGNPEVLREFEKANHTALRKPGNEGAKRYIDARIRTAEKLSTMQENMQRRAAQGKLPPKLAVDVRGLSR